MNKYLVPVVVATISVSAVSAIVGSRLFVNAASSERFGTHGSVESQVFRALKTPTSTTDQEFSRIPDLQLVVCNRGALSVDVAGNISGGSAAFRAVLEAPGREAVMPPGEIRIAPRDEPDAVTFSFGRSSGKRNTRFIHFEWRSITGEAITLHSALTRTFYNAPSRACV